MFARHSWQSAALSGSFEIHELSEQSWVVADYSLTIGTLVCPSGRLDDVCEYKRMLVIGHMSFAIWSLMVGLAIYEKTNG
jgi:hypothetical protein